MQLKSFKKVNRLLITFFCCFIISLLIFPLLTQTVTAELTDADFSSLSYTDPKGDQYTHYQKFDDESDEQLESYGVKGKYSKSFSLETTCVDIVSLDASLNSGTVTITMEYASDIMYGSSLEYSVYFVKPSHQQPDVLLDPQEQDYWLGYWDKSEDEDTYINIGFDSDSFDGTVYAWSNSDLPSLEADADGNIITITVSASELEDAGLASGSGFGLYAYSHVFGSLFQEGVVIGEVTWDTVGVGAASAPAEFNSDLYGKEDGDDDEDSIDSNFLLFGAVVCIVIIIVIGVITVVILVLYFNKKKTKPTQMQYPQDTQYEQGEYPPPPPPPRQY